MKKVHVDREGQHCILICDHELFYLNWKDNRVFPISTSGSDSRPRAFQSIDIHHEVGEENFFEVLLGTQDGQIFHAALEYSQGGAKGSALEVVEPFTHVIEMPGAGPVLDLKIA